MLESIVLTKQRRSHDARFVRHVASGGVTLCGIELGGSIPDPPALDAARAAGEVHRCAICHRTNAGAVGRAILGGLARVAS